MHSIITSLKSNWKDLKNKDFRYNQDNDSFVSFRRSMNMRNKLMSVNTISRYGLEPPSEPKPRKIKKNEDDYIRFTSPIKGKLRDEHFSNTTVLGSSKQFQNCLKNQLKLHQRVELKKGFQNFTKRHQSVQKNNDLGLSVNRSINRSMQENQISKNMSVQTIRSNLKIPKIAKNHRNYQESGLALFNQTPMQLSGRSIYKT